MENQYKFADLLLHIDKVSMQRGQDLILREVTATVYDVEAVSEVRGQVVGFLGPSGIGKTTLFMIMAGLLQPTAGRVMINGHTDTVKPGEVGVVFQDYPLFRHLTVLANLVIAGRQAGLTKIQATDKARGLLELFEMSSRASHYPEQLSGGQRQRIAIAQQVMCSDHFILMDEPFSGLDINAKDKVCNLIRKVADMDTLNTIVIVTHDIPSAVRISDFIWLMGRDRDPATSDVIPGARIQQDYNLIDLDLAWHPDIDKTPQFTEFVREIEARFRKL